MTELKRCPFCGGEAELLQGVTEIHNYVMCMHCFCKTQYYNTKKRAIQTWNTRKPMDRIVERLEEEMGNSYCAKAEFADGMNYTSEYVCCGEIDAYEKAIQIVKEGLK